MDPFYARRRRFEAALRPLALDGLFAALPRYLKEGYWKEKLPDPALVFDDTVPNGREHEPMRAAVEAGFRNAKIHIFDEEMSVREFIAVLMGLKNAVAQTERLPKMPEPIAQFFDQAPPILDYCHDTFMPEAAMALFMAANVPCTAHSRLDTRLLTTRLTSEPEPSGKIAVRVIISAAEPQVRHVSLDGSPRPMYRVANSCNPNGVKWLSWNGAQLGNGDADAKYPVYVQSHALRQLHQRVNLPAAAPYLQSWLAASLEQPKIVERQQGGDLLVEYRIRENRLGYLVVTPMADLVAVRTFKFLTMEHTPEARLLQKQLRLTRRDIDWLRLDELTAFTQTDLCDDLVLRSMLEACGCGHLFSISEEGETIYAPKPKPFAADLRRYLRMAA